jgi:hypothetical protein
MSIDEQGGTTPEQPSGGPPPEPAEQWAAPTGTGSTDLVAGEVSPKSDAERKRILAQQIQQATVQQRRVESQSEFQATLAYGQPVNHTLHLIAAIFTCGIWGIVWLVLALTGGVKRELLVVDDYGNVQLQQLGKA